MYVCMYVCMYVKILFQHNNRLGKGDGIYDILSNNDGESTHAGILWAYTGYNLTATSLRVSTKNLVKMAMFHVFKQYSM